MKIVALTLLKATTLRFVIGANSKWQHGLGHLQNEQDIFGMVLYSSKLSSKIVTVSLSIMTEHLSWLSIHMEGKKEDFMYLFNRNHYTKY